MEYFYFWRYGFEILKNNIKKRNIKKRFEKLQLVVKYPES